MANKVKFELNRAGVRGLMKSNEMVSVLEGYGKNALSSLGDGYEIETFQGKTRANVEVKAVSFKARRENMSDNTILKAVH
jgi:hypothetical protein